MKEFEQVTREVYEAFDAGLVRYIDFFLELALLSERWVDRKPLKTWQADLIKRELERRKAGQKTAP